jgi:hypothetical protein
MAALENRLDTMQQRKVKTRTLQKPKSAAPAKDKRSLQ